MARMGSCVLLLWTWSGFFRCHGCSGPERTYTYCRLFSVKYKEEDGECTRDLWKECFRKNWGREGILVSAIIEGVLTTAEDERYNANQSMLAWTCFSSAVEAVEVVKEIHTSLSVWVVCTLKRRVVEHRRPFRDPRGMWCGRARILSCGRHQSKKKKQCKWCSRSNLLRDKDVFAICCHSWSRSHLTFLSM